MPYASVYPLVTTRALARPLTYEVDEGVGKGAVVSIPLGRSRVRGVVVGNESSAPEGVRTVPVTGVVAEVSSTLVDLALWVAEYYGSTPARALALVAPPLRTRRGERRQPAESYALTGEDAPIALSQPQEAALGRLEEAMAAGGGHFLLYGETGSGKTEVYLRACAAAIERGRDAIVLVPEIALTPQTVGRFRARFGELVAVLHSGLTDAERRDERERITAGEARIVVGARSAIFAPVRSLGVVCVDEEHDSSYKQESDPRYDARTVAAKRAALEGAVAVYGSATPRPESWARLEHLELGSRLGVDLPGVRVVDMRREAAYPLSGELVAALEGVAERRSRAIVLLNRRGVAPAVHCRSCGATIRCEDCDVALVLHRDDVLRCHHCGRSRHAPELCDACGSPELMRIGAGTQKLESELARLVPGLERIRLDADTASKPAELAAALERFRQTESAVLLGTQMVAKGHHFAGVELAAVVDADLGLGLPDFRAEERTFQLVTQLAGRSGRDAPGRVIVQTFQPDASALVFAARHDVVGFLAAELERREALGYPPFRHVVRVLVSGRSADGPLRALMELKSRFGSEDVVGPAPLSRLRGRHRAQLIAKTDAPRNVAGQAGRWLAAAATSMRKAGLGVGRRRSAELLGGVAPDGFVAVPAQTSTNFLITLKPGGGAGWPQTAEYTGAVASEPDTMPPEEAEAEEAEAGEEEEERPDPEREARKLVALAQIRQYPDPVLRMRAKEVESFDGELDQLVQRLKAIMEGADGAGLAATQVGVLRRVFVMRTSEEGETVVLVNPELVAHGEELETDEEGCLSLQGLLVPVERPASVTVSAKDPTGAPVSLELEGFAARAAQHELDHLDGVLMIDRTTDEARREAMARLRRGPVIGARS